MNPYNTLDTIDDVFSIFPLSFINVVLYNVNSLGLLYAQGNYTLHIISLLTMVTIITF